MAATHPAASGVAARLVPPLDATQATEVAAACLRDTFRAVDSFLARQDDVRATVLLAGGDGAGADRAGWIPDGWDVQRQAAATSGPDLTGERLAEAFDRLGAGMVIGAATPTAVAHLDAAFAALRAGRHVLGLTVGGAVWGVGLHDVNESILERLASGAALTGTDRLPAVRSLDGFDDLAPLVGEHPGGHLASVAVSLFNRRWG